MHNQSQDQIDLRSKFRSKVQRSQSVPNAFEALTMKKIQLFPNQTAKRKDSNTDDDLTTDDDFTDIEQDDDDELPRASTTGRKHQKGPTLGLDAIIDEDEELNDCEYQSPMSFGSNEFKFPDSLHSSPYNGSSKRDSAITMMSVSDLSLQHPSPHTNSNIDNQQNITRQPRSKSSHTRKLSSTFKAMFNGQKSPKDGGKSKSQHTTPRAIIDKRNEMKYNGDDDNNSKKKKKKKGIVRMPARNRSSSANPSAGNIKNKNEHKRGGSSRLFHRLSFKKGKDKKAMIKTDSNQSKEISPKTKKKKRNIITKQRTVIF